MVLNLKEIYERYVKPLPAVERLRLMEMRARDLASPTGEPEKASKRSVLELHGLCKDIWKGVDAQEYVNKLRQEWDNRP